METPSLLASLYPLLAPLPVPFCEHLVHVIQRGKEGTSITAWDILANKVKSSRVSVFMYMHSFVSIGARQIKQQGSMRYSTGWLLETLQNNSPGKKPIASQTLYDWQVRGLLRSQRHGYPDPDSAASLLIARMIASGERGWLPSSMEKDEPAWWCWRQDTPGAPVLPCPVPLPMDLPSSALLWTPWAGAAWDQSWLQVGKNHVYPCGAIRWAGVYKMHGQQRWALSLDDLLQWGSPEVRPLLTQLLQRQRIPMKIDGTKEHLDDLIQTTAQFILQDLASSRLFP